MEPSVLLSLSGQRRAESRTCHVLCEGVAPKKKRKIEPSHSRESKFSSKEKAYKL